MLSGGRLTSERTHESGRLKELHAPEDLDGRARAHARILVGRSAPRPSAIKRLLYKGQDLSLEEGLRIEQAVLPGILASADYAEDLAAFLERRAPRFTEVVQ